MFVTVFLPQEWAKTKFTDSPPSTSDHPSHGHSNYTLLPLSY